MKQVYTNVIPLANSPADRLAALEALCRSVGRRRSFRPTSTAKPTS